LLTAAVLGNLVSALFVYLRAERKALTFLCISAAGAALETSLLSTLLSGHRFSLPVLLGVEACKQGFLMLCIAAVARRDLSRLPAWRELARQLAFGLWFIPIGLGEWFITGSDRFWLGKLGSLDDVGVYGFTYRFVMPLSVLFAGGLMNAHARLYRFSGAEGEPLARELLSVFLKRAGLLTAAAAALLPAALWMAGRRFHLFPEAYLDGLPAAPLMAAVIFALYWARYYAAILEYRLRARALMFAETGIALLSAALIPAAIVCARNLEGSVLCGAALGALAAKGIGIAVLARLARLRGGWRSPAAGLATLAACLALSAAWNAWIR
jgi:O-antigen/teichoic acid export membrane protein